MSDSVAYFGLCSNFWDDWTSSEKILQFFFVNLPKRCIFHQFYNAKCERVIGAQIPITSGPISNDIVCRLLDPLQQNRQQVTTHHVVIDSSIWTTWTVSDRDVKRLCIVSSITNVCQVPIEVSRRN